MTTPKLITITFADCSKLFMTEESNVAYFPESTAWKFVEQFKKYPSPLMLRYDLIIDREDILTVTVNFNNPNIAE